MKLFICALYFYRLPALLELWQQLASAAAVEFQARHQTTKSRSTSSSSSSIYNHVIPQIACLRFQQKDTAHLGCCLWSKSTMCAVASVISVWLSRVYVGWISVEQSVGWICVVTTLWLSRVCVMCGVWCVWLSRVWIGSSGRCIIQCNQQQCTAQRNYDVQYTQWLRRVWVGSSARCRSFHGLWAAFCTQLDTQLFHLIQIQNKKPYKYLYLYHLPFDTITR